MPIVDETWLCKTELSVRRNVRSAGMSSFVTAEKAIVLPILYVCWLLFASTTPKCRDVQSLCHNVINMLTYTVNVDYNSKHSFTPAQVLQLRGHIDWMLNSTEETIRCMNGITGDGPIRAWKSAWEHICSSESSGISCQNRLPHSPFLNVNVQGENRQWWEDMIHLLGEQYECSKSRLEMYSGGSMTWVFCDPFCFATPLTVLHCEVLFRLSRRRVVALQRLYASFVRRSSCFILQVHQVTSLLQLYHECAMGHTCRRLNGSRMLNCLRIKPDAKT